MLFCDGLCYCALYIVFFAKRSNRIILFVNTDKFVYFFVTFFEKKIIPCYKINVCTSRVLINLIKSTIISGNDLSATFVTSDG